MFRYWPGELNPTFNMEAGKARCTARDLSFRQLGLRKDVGPFVNICNSEAVTIDRTLRDANPSAKVLWCDTREV